MNLQGFMGWCAVGGVLAGGAGYAGLATWTAVRDRPATVASADGARAGVAAVAPLPSSPAPEPTVRAAAPSAPQPAAPVATQAASQPAAHAAARHVAVHRRVPALRPPTPARQMTANRAEVYYPVRPADPYGYRWVYQRVY